LKWVGIDNYIQDFSAESVSDREWYSNFTTLLKGKIAVE